MVGVVALVALALTVVGEPVAAGPPARDFEITTLSTRADMVTGGDVLVRIDVPRTVPLHQVRATVDGRDVSAAFAPAPDGSRALLGVVDSLELGVNTLQVRANGAGRGRPSASLALTNHPITGPVFSGPHQTPFICETEEFGLGPALDEHCSANTRVEYVYRTTDGEFEPFDPDGPRPADLAQTTTTEGDTVNFIVRLETGTINRAVYEIVFLHQPGTPLPDPLTTTPGWNGRLVYTFGGGLRASYHQGARSGGVVADNLTGGRSLADGFAVVSSSLNVLGNSGNDVVSAETAMMVKEYFIESFGDPDHTIGLGASGGAMQQHLISHNYPGILDGIIPRRGFPDSWTFLATYTDCGLVHEALETSPSTWTDEQKQAVIGHMVYDFCGDNGPSWSQRINPTDCDAVIPEELIFDPVANPDGVRCTIHDNQVNIFGQDPETGFARRPLDNAGVQYGLKAFNDGVIDFDQFIELNERVGGFDVNGNTVAERMEADPAALNIAYQTGRVNSGAGLDAIPIIDVREYRDHEGNVHDAVRTLSMRERLIAANGHAVNQVTWVGERQLAQDLNYAALRLMDEWLTAIAADGGPGTTAEKVVRNKPADAVDACFTDAGGRITDRAVCEELFPPQANPRMVAGGPLSDDVLKCALKPIDPDDYSVELSEDQLAHLAEVFASGVCDFSRPGVGQQPVADTWLSYARSGQGPGKAGW